MERFKIPGIGYIKSKVFLMEGRNTLKPEINGLDLQRIIEDSIRTSRDLAVDIPVGVIAEYPAHLPAVGILREDLTGVLTSLITHLLYYTTHPEIRVRARLVTRDGLPGIERIPLESRPAVGDSGPWVLLSIADTEEPIMQYANDMFLDATVVKNNHYQLLLSVAACKRTLEASGGTMWVEFQQEIGSRFYLLLAIHAAHLQTTDFSILFRTMETHIPEGQAQGKTILLLTANTSLRTVLAQDLAAGGYRVLVTGESAELLRVARTEVVELALLDIEMRDPNVFDLAMVLKADSVTRNLPILFLTSMEDEQHHMHIGAVDFLSRPVGTGKLLSIVNDFLRTRLKPNARVLVVEPEENLRSSLIMIIRDHGYRVSEAEGAEEAIVLAERFMPRLILVNARMARERDYWLLRQMRRLDSEAEILVLADEYSELEGKEVMNRGASRYAETGKLPDLLDGAP